jgi:sec-independent protein translocase protein TatB
MFDFGFSEILLIFVLALIVLGPEKMPRVAAQVGRWIGRARGMARQFREQLEEEVNLEDARKSQAAMTRTAAPSSVTAQPVPPDTQIAPAAAGSAPDTQVALPDGTVVVPQVASDAPTDASAALPDGTAVPQSEPQVVYPDYHSHAHPTDELGREIAPGEPADPLQQDWVSATAAPHKPVSNATDAAYAPPNERGT